MRFRLIGAFVLALGARAWALDAGTAVPTIELVAPPLTPMSLPAAAAPSGLLPAGMIASAVVAPRQAPQAPQVSSQKADPTAAQPRRLAFKELEGWKRKLALEIKADSAVSGRQPKAVQWRPGPLMDRLGPRNPARIYQLERTASGQALRVHNGRARRIVEGARYNYVLMADGTLEIGLPASRRDRGVKHIQIADSRLVIFSGELRRADGRIVMDLNSGTFSDCGLDPRWAHTPENMALLRRYAELATGERVTVVRWASSVKPKRRLSP